MALASRSGRRRRPDERPSSPAMRSAADASGAWTETRRPGNARAFSRSTLVFLGITAMLGLAGLSAAEGLLAWDVRFAYLPAAEAVLHGHSPYPALDDPILDEQKGYVYPPQLLFVLLPLTRSARRRGVRARRGGHDRAAPPDAPRARGARRPLLRRRASLGARDQRRPALESLHPAGVRARRHVALSGRDRGPAIALGLSVSAKLLLWPMFVWTLATQAAAHVRSRPCSSESLVTLAAWAAIGFDGFSTLPRPPRPPLGAPVASQLLLRRNGVDAPGSTRSSGACSPCSSVARLLVGCVVFARRERRAPRSFTCAVAATLALSPVVWLHYLVAAARPAGHPASAVLVRSGCCRCCSGSVRSRGMRKASRRSCRRSSRLCSSRCS